MWKKAIEDRPMNAMSQITDPELESFKKRLSHDEAMRVRRKRLVRIAQVILLVALLGLWQGVVSLGLANAIFVGSPLGILTELAVNVANGNFFVQALPTLVAVVVAFVLSAVVGIALGILLHEIPFLDAVLSPFVAALNGVPRIALAPVTIVWFGLGFGSKVALAFSLVVFILLITTEAALKNVDSDLTTLCRSLGASRLKTLLSVKLPWSLPSLFAGLRLGLLYTILSVIVNEMISSPDGLGALISYYSNTFAISDMFAVLVFLSFFTIIFDVGLRYLERRMKVW